MTTRMKRCVLLASAVVPFVACTSSNPVGGDAGGDGAAPLTLDVTGACADSADAVYQAPPADFASKPKGDILRCAKDGPIAMADLEAQARKDGYKGRAFTSGAKVYRVMYRTERGDAASSPGYSSAAVYLPDAPRAAGLPVVMLARASRGQAAKCAASRQDPSQEGVNVDYRRLIYPLVGAGYAVIVTDLAGYANYGAPGNPPSGYAAAADVGKSTLDSGRALKALVPALGDKAVVVGHSQGGHTALASLAMADAYGTAGTLVGVATYAPLWLSQRAWGAVADASVGASYKIDTDIPAAVSLWYNYTHGELFDGPGHGVDVFKASSRAAIKAFVDTQCWEPEPHPELTGLGTHVSDLYDPAFGNSVGLPAAFTGACSDATCTTWLKRYADDRPHITSKLPILVLYGGSDTSIDPTRITCAVDRLKDDAANMSFCYMQGEDHHTILGAKADYVADWIAGLTLGKTPPDACPMNETAITYDGGPAKCATPPPND